MASMDDSFRVRVEKIFGSLQASQYSPFKQPPSLWSLTDDEVERKEWRRDSGDSDRQDMPCSSSFDEFLKEERKYRCGRSLRKELDDDLDDIDDDDGGDGGWNGLRRGRGDGDGDEWEIRSSIGLDRTLDNEEEEDEYDKVASGRENAGERLYMREVSQHGSYLNSENVLYNTTTKDPRANHLAARIRLKEDDAEAQIFTSHGGSDGEIKERQVKPHVVGSDSGGHVRSILKRKKNNEGSKPQKRVRFDPVCTNDREESSEKSQEYTMETLSINTKMSGGRSLSAEDTQKVPDYILNPSRYTRYSLDSSSEVDEVSNTQTCMDFLKSVGKSKSAESGSEVEDAEHDLPKVTFIPKKKKSDFQAGKNSSEVTESEDFGEQRLHATGFPLGIAAGEAQNSEVDAMEEDEPETNTADKKAAVHRCGRSYRIKSRSDDDLDA